MENKNQNLHLFMIILVLIGSLTWGLIGTMNYNLIHNILFGNTIAKKIAYTLIGISGIYLALCRNTYWPYLGESVFPNHLFQHCPMPTEGKEIMISTPYPNTALVYWVKNEKDGSLFNSAVSKTNNLGLAKIVLAEPDKKDVPGYWIIPKEIFYRAIVGTGMLSKVEKTRI